MPVEFRRRGPAISESDVAEFEERVGHRLPDDYRVFMLESNGGVPRANYLPSNENVGVRAFFMLGDDPHYAIGEMLRVFEGRYPVGMLPVAEDSSGNLLLIDVGRQEMGSVWFWEHEFEAEDDEPPRPDNITRIASSFHELLDALRPDSDLDDDPDVVRMVETGRLGYVDPDYVPRFD